ncbi:MAG TPA: transglycosylase SLT domain-containing protein [Candidatus Binatia bacterium]|nr:transglycosylase SLT domain-containing protein [Candidatus Binatia bacterium]
MRRLLVGLATATTLAACTRPLAPPQFPTAGPSPADRRAEFSAALRSLKSGDCRDAAGRFETLLRTYPGLTDYHLYYRGMALQRCGRDAEAAAALQRVVDQFQESVHRDSAALDLGRLQIKLAEPAAARVSLGIAAAARDHATAHQAEMELAHLDLADHDVARAANRFQAVRRAAPRTQIGTDARTELDRLRAAHPELAPTGTLLVDEVRLLLSEGDATAAEALARRLLEATDAAERTTLLHLHASALQSLGRIDEAIEDLRAAARREVGETAAATHFRVASILWNRDRDDEALAAFVEFRRRFARAENANEALYAIGRIHEKAGRAEAAIAAYRQLAAVARDRLGREAQWRIGWIHYQHGRYAVAAQDFAALAGCRNADDCADGRYWQARALEHTGDVARAHALYQRLAHEAPASYYAMVAERRLGTLATTPVAIQPPAPPPVPPAHGDFHLERAMELTGAGMSPLARDELAAYERDHADDRTALRQLLQWYRAVDGDGAAIRLIRRLGDDAGLAAAERERVLYPLGFWPLVSDAAAHASLDPLLVAAVIRQESLYDPNAHSPADAFGLMQVLPSTARRVAGAPVTVDELRDPQRNVALGTGYLAQLIRQFDGDRIKAIAAYNGGEAAVEKWQRRSPGLDSDEFVEAISYRETREYVKRVIGGYRRYRQLYAVSPQ